MKWFLITSSLLLVAALLLVVGVFLYVNMSVETSQSSTPTASSTALTGSSTDEATSETETSSAAESDSRVPTEGIPLRDLPLSEGQKEAVALVGIDIETFVITPQMQVCAEGKLGADRMDEIIAGAAPSFMETTKMLPCLNVD